VRIQTCLTLEENVPKSEFTATLQALDPGQSRPIELARPASNPRLPPAAEIRVDEKSKERELDVAVLLASAVKDERDAAQNNALVRKRDNTATVDLRFMPIRNWTRLAVDRGYWLTFFSPFVADAKVSNKPITKDTLSLNRIVLGSEFEYRWYRNVQETPSRDFYRLIVKGGNTSDRDFKLNEFKGGVEFRPSPPKLNWELRKGAGLGVDRWLGRSFVPVLGFEAGKSYVRGRPAQVLVPLGRLYRGYAGLEISFNVLNRMTTSAQHLFYFRGEEQSDQVVVSYSKAGLEFQIPGASRLAAPFLYMSYEKGRLPPFNAWVNVFKVGFRFQSTGWPWSGVR
jgi:hypothetical protein